MKINIKGFTILVFFLMLLLPHVSAIEYDQITNNIKKEINEVNVQFEENNKLSKVKQTNIEVIYKIITEKTNIFNKSIIQKLRLILVYILSVYCVPLSLFSIIFDILLSPIILLFYYTWKYIYPPQNPELYLLIDLFIVFNFPIFLINASTLVIDSNGELRLWRATINVINDFKDSIWRN